MLRLPIAALAVFAATFTIAVHAQAANRRQALAATTDTPVQAAPAASSSQERQIEFVRAQAAARQILSRPEFQPAQETWWDHMKERLQEWLARFFLGIDHATARSPWVGHLLEWLLFLSAGAGLLVWLLRAAHRQRVHAVPSNPALASTEWDHESEHWLQLAQQHAAAGEWRDAIHALYWAAIVLLERRRAWRHNAARTPREYLRLLRAGSVEQSALRDLTHALERTWYGQRSAQPDEYAEAHASFERLTRNADSTPAGGRA